MTTGISPNSADALAKTKGVSIFSFTDPTLALEHIGIKKQSYILVISDLRMPGMDRMDLLKAVKNLNPHLRTIVVTAFELDEIIFKEFVRRKIINGFLQNPIHLYDLHGEVSRQLHLYELQKRKALIRVNKKLGALC
jgi:DNA-binding NtrC family response regulator